LQNRNIFPVLGTKIKAKNNFVFFSSTSLSIHENQLQDTIFFKNNFKNVALKFAASQLFCLVGWLRFENRN
jgi:hypothetical protein